MGTLQVRQHDRKSRLWWVSADSGEDVAYIARPGTNYWAWITDKWGSEYPSFVGRRSKASMKHSKRSATNPKFLFD